MGKQLTEYQKFVKANASKHKLKNGMVDLKTIGRLWRASGKSSSTKKPKKRSAAPKTKPRTRSRSVTTTTRKKTVPKKKPRGKAERKKDGLKKEFQEIARSLNVPMGKTSFKFVNGTWRIRITGLGKTVKRAKLGDAMRIVRKRARSKI